MAPDELVDTNEAARLLEFEPDRVEEMARDGMLSPIGEGSERRFRRAEVVALRELGG